MPESTELRIESKQEFLPRVTEEELQELRKRQDVRIRTEYVIHDSDNRPEESTPNYSKSEAFLQRQLQDTAAYYTDMKRMFEGMRDNYGVNIAEIQSMSIGEEKGETKVFMTVDKIEGEDLEHIKKLEEQEKLEAFLCGLFQAIFDAYQEQKTFFGDYGSPNIMYGHRAGDGNDEKNYFLADVGLGGFVHEDRTELAIEHGYFQKGKNPSYDENFFAAIMLAIQDLKMYEAKLGKGASLAQTRGKLREIYRYLKATKETALEAYLDNNSFMKPTEEYFEKVA